MHTFTMPTLGADMEAGTLVSWRKQPGDTVSRGDVIAEVDTDKGVIDVEVFAEGTLDEILIEPGTRVPVGTPLATIRELAEGGAGFGTSPESPRAVPPPSPVRKKANPHAVLRSVSRCGPLRPARPHAACDRGGDDPLEAGDSALLPLHDDRPQAGHLLARS